MLGGATHPNAVALCIFLRLQVSFAPRSGRCAQQSAMANRGPCLDGSGCGECAAVSGRSEPGLSRNVCLLRLRPD